MFRSRNFSQPWFFVIVLFLTQWLVVGAQDAFSTSPSLMSTKLHLSGSLSAQGVVLLSEGLPSLKLVADGPDDEADLSATFHIYDHNAEERLSATVPLRVGSATELDLGQLDPGWYRVRYRVSVVDGSRELARGSQDFVILRGVAAESSPTLSPFGVVNSRLQPHEGYIVRQMGAGWVWEAATPTWAEVQFQPGGQLMWRARSESVEAVQAAGLVPAGNIGDEPTWARLAGLRDDPYLTDFYRFAHAYITEVASGAAIATVPLFDSVWDNWDAALDYEKCIKVTAAALRRGRSAASQILEVEKLTPHDMEQLLRHGVLDRIDVVLFHLPPVDSPPEEVDWGALERTRGQLRSLGSGAAIWTVMPNVPNTKKESTVTISLFGVPTPSETDAQGGFDTLTQAQWLVRSHVLQLAHGVERIFASPFSTGPSELRLFSGGAGAYPDMPQRPRPSIAAYATMAEMLTGATYIGQLSMPFGIWAFAFAKQGEPVLVVWTTRSSATLELNNVNVPVVQVTDMLGRRSELPVVSGRLVLPIGPSPQYVQGFDVGLLAQALIDQFGQRLDLLRDVAEWAERDINALADGVYDLATELWVTAQDPRADLDQLIPTWYETVDKMLQFGYSLVGQEGAAEGALYELFDLLAIMAELGAVMGIADDPDEQAAQVLGTDALLADARNALLENMSAQGGIIPHAAGLLEKVQKRWEQSSSGSLAARTAWSVIARESAALAMMQSFVETPSVPDLFVLVDVTSAERSFPGFSPYEPSTVATVWEHIESVIDSWHVRRGTVLTAGKGTSSTEESIEATASGWDALTLPATAVTFSDREVLSHLVLEGPSGWLWRVEGTDGMIRPVGERVDLELPRGTADGGVAVPLAIDLLIPYDAPVGMYEAVLTLYKGTGIADRIEFTIRVSDAPPPERPTPHEPEQLPTASPS